MNPETERMIRRAIGGDETAASWIAAEAMTTTEVLVIVVAALLAPSRTPLIRARSIAASRVDRELVAIADAHLRGDRELVDALAREHLLDHPGSIVVAWVASQGSSGSGIATDL